MFLSLNRFSQTIIITFFTAVIMLGLSTDVAKACTCPEPNPEMAKETLGFMDYVFEGEVIRKQPKALRRSPLVTIKITRKFKGDFISEEMVFAYNSLPHTCGNVFEVGETVTLGAYNMIGTQPRLTHICAQRAVRQHLKNIGGYIR